MTATRLSKIKVKLQMIMEIKRKCNIMKKIGLICATLLASLSLSACNNLASQQHKASSSSSAKVVKYHKAHKKVSKKANKKKQSSSSVSASTINQSTQSSQQQTTSSSTVQSSSSSQPNAWNSRQQARDQASQNGGPTTEDQARAMLGGANGDLQATRTSNGWTFSGDGYTATVNDDGTISHN